MTTRFISVLDEFLFDFREVGRVQWGQSSESTTQESTPHAMRYFIDDETIDRRFGYEIDSLSADWMDVALACYLADRLALRPILRTGGRHWSRAFKVILPVRELDRWTNPVKCSLAALLRFLTEDIWQFEFVRYQGPRRAVGLQRSLFPFKPDPTTRVALYSGGLDSFAGTARELCTSSRSNCVLVSGVTNPRQQAAQRSQVGRIWFSIPHVGRGFGNCRRGIKAFSLRKRHWRDQSSLRCNPNRNVQFTGNSSLNHLEDAAVHQCAYGAELFYREPVLVHDQRTDVRT